MNTSRYNRKKTFKLSRKAKLLERSGAIRGAKKYSQMALIARGTRAAKSVRSRKATRRVQTKPVHNMNIEPDLRRSTRVKKAVDVFDPSVYIRPSTASTRKSRKQTAKKITKKEESNLTNLFSRFGF